MTERKQREWTLMFYFASDNALAPEIVSQLKAITQAGFHPEVNVIAQFDPHTVGTPTHIFAVNSIKKHQANGGSKIGFIGNSERDPFVVNLMIDKIWGNETDLRDNLIRDRIRKEIRRPGLPEYNQPDPPPMPGTSECQPGRRSEEPSPEESLTTFLKFCREKYPAKHYMLFILGHGQVVGNDIFLFDENATVPALQLAELGVVLRHFAEDIKKDKEGKETGAQFEFVGFNSCSISSLEVAYELEGVAKFMLASQGPAYVGSWPYRQIMIRVLRNLDEQPRFDIKEMLTKIFYYCVYNSYDYLAAGYSYDLCLCDLNRVKEIKEPLAKLTKALIEGLCLEAPLVRELILFAHLESQSYWNENYTDLFDFCFRLQRRISRVQPVSGEVAGALRKIQRACGDVIKVLERGTVYDDDRLVVRSDFAGPATQFSHGLSVYFPWTRPVKRDFLECEYLNYRFTQEQGRRFGRSWREFLLVYFNRTMRRPRSVEACGEPRPLSFQDELLEVFASNVYNVNGQLEKPTATSPSGDSCDCQTVKNFPPFTRERSAPGIKCEELTGDKTLAQTSTREGDRGQMVSSTFLDDATFREDAAFLEELK